jgi:hypothetical protein
VRREKIYVGNFTDFGAAVAVRKAAEQRYFGCDPHAVPVQVDQRAQMELPL